MTQEQIEDLVARWVPRLSLTHWKLTVDWENAAEDCEAQVDWADSYDEAVLHFAETHTDWTRDKAEHVVVHELVHLIFRDLQATAKAGRTPLGLAARTVAEVAFEHELEGVVDRVAAALVALGPHGRLIVTDAVA
jgi:hypothetical protein